MYKYKNEEKLSPPAHQPTEAEIKLAKARYAMEYPIWEMMDKLTMYYEMTKGKEPSFPYTNEGIEKDAKEAMEEWNKGMDKWEGDMWDAFIDHDWFKKAYIDGLSDMHCGDCTAIACSCMRCHSEQMFGIPNTANWGKNEGWRLWNEYSKDVDDQKKTGEKD